MTASNHRVIIYTDGGADPNPGPGGWGVVMIDGRSGRKKELSGSENRTTNNRMELTAAIRALEALQAPSQVGLYTDSQYLRQGITLWLPGWIRRGWQRKGGELKNVDLWQRLAGLVKRHRIEWHWVKGHAGNEHNERADALATAAIRKRKGKPAKTVDDPPTSPADVEIVLAVAGRGKRGAWAALVRDREDERERAERASGSGPRLEILAAAELLEGLGAKPRTVAFFTRSDYLRGGASSWIARWQKNGWKTAAGQPVKNRDAWERLAAVQRPHRVRWPEVKGRTEGDVVERFERVEKLAREKLAG